METSHYIATEWIKNTKKGTKGIPSASLVELAGQMEEHSITLRGQFESEMKQYSNKADENG
jgi:hypothetical protein